MKHTDPIGGVGATNVYPEGISIPRLSPAIKSGNVASSEYSSYANMRPKASLQQQGSSASSLHLDNSSNILNTMNSPTPMLQTSTSEFGHHPSLSIAVIGATGELARRKIFPALFALYYGGFLPEVYFSFLLLWFVLSLF